MVITKNHQKHVVPTGLARNGHKFRKTANC